MTRLRTVSARKAPERCTGTASVEFVLVLPVLMALFALAVDGGRMLADYHAVSKSVRDAARYMARADGGSAPCAAGSLSRNRTDVANAVRLAMTGRVDGDPAGDTLVAGWRAADLSEAATGISVARECLDNSSGALAGLYGQANTIPSLVVSARVPFSFGPGRFLGLGPAITLTVAHKTAITGV